MLAISNKPTTQTKMLVSSVLVLLLVGAEGGHASSLGALGRTKRQAIAAVPATVAAVPVDSSFRYPVKGYDGGQKTIDQQPYYPGQLDWLRNQKSLAWPSTSASEPVATGLLQDSPLNESGLYNSLTSSSYGYPSYSSYPSSYGYGGYGGYGGGYGGRGWGGFGRKGGHGGGGKGQWGIKY